MLGILSENLNNTKFEFNNLKNNKVLENSSLIKELAIRGAKGSSYIEDINLPEQFFVTSYELEEASKS